MFGFFKLSEGHSQGSAYNESQPLTRSVWSVGAEVWVGGDAGGEQLGELVTFL